MSKKLSVVLVTFLFAFTSIAAGNMPQISPQQMLGAYLQTSMAFLATGSQMQSLNERQYSQVLQQMKQMRAAISDLKGALVSSDVQFAEQHIHMFRQAIGQIIKMPSQQDIEAKFAGIPAEFKAQVNIQEMVDVGVKTAQFFARYLPADYSTIEMKTLIAKIDEGCARLYMELTR